MSHTYYVLLTHIVFSTSHRIPWLTERIADRVYRYTRGIIQQTCGKTIALNGMPDHVHMLVSFPPTVKISDAVRTIKTNSSRWISEERLADEFAWQTGYASFSIGRTERDMVIRYIESQQAHHREISFEDELLQMLHDYDVEYDPRYLWD